MTSREFFARLRLTQGHNLTLTWSVSTPGDNHIKLVIDSVDAHVGRAHVVANWNCRAAREVLRPLPCHFLEYRTANPRTKHPFKTIRPLPAQIPLAKCGTVRLD